MKKILKNSMVIFLVLGLMSFQPLEHTLETIQNPSTTTKAAITYKYSKDSKAVICSGLGQTQLLDDAKSLKFGKCN